MTDHHHTNSDQNQNHRNDNDHSDMIQRNIESFKSKAASYDHAGSRLVTKAIGEKILQFRFLGTTSDDDQIVETEFSRSEEYNDENFDSSPDVDVADVNTALWDPESTRVLDFACGTGLISEVLAAHTKQIIGLDISQDMVDVYNKKVHDHGVPVDEMQAYVGDITKPEQLEMIKDLHDFDAAVCSLAYHHIEDIDRVTQRLVDLLRTDGGRLYVVDLEKGTRTHLSRDEAHSHGVAHHGGLDSGLIAGAFQKAGLKKVTVTKCFRCATWMPVEFMKRLATKEVKEINGKQMHRVQMDLVLVTGMKG